MLIELRNVNKEYANGKNVKATPLINVDFRVDEGEKVVISGPSGIGKSTLLNIIGCIDNVTSGEYLFKGEYIENYSEKQKAEIRNRNIGYVLQNNGLISYRNVYDNVSVPLIYNKLVKKNEYRDKIEHALESVGMSNYAKRNVDELSGGEKQRVAIARAIVNNPDIILADEPTGALDWKNKEKIMDLLFEMGEDGRTLIMVTHDMEIAERFSHHYSFNTDGKINRIR